MLEDRAVLALETLGGGRPLDADRRRARAAVRVAAPSLTPSSQNTMRTPLAGGAKRGKFELQVAWPSEHVPSLGWRDERVRLEGMASAAGPCKAPAAAKPRSATTVPEWPVRGALGRGGKCAERRRQAAWCTGTARSVAPMSRPRINDLLCILKGFALARPFCWAIKKGYKRGSRLPSECAHRGHGGPGAFREVGRDGDALVGWGRSGVISSAPRSVRSW